MNNLPNEYYSCDFYYINKQNILNVNVRKIVFILFIYFNYYKYKFELIILQFKFSII